MKRVIILLGLLVLSCSSDDNDQEQELNFLEQYDGFVFRSESTSGITYSRIVNNENAPIEVWIRFLSLHPNDCFIIAPFEVFEPGAVITKLEPDLMEISRPMYDDLELIRSYTVSNNALSIEVEWYLNGELETTGIDLLIPISFDNIDELPLCD